MCGQQWRKSSPFLFWRRNENMWIARQDASFAFCSCWWGGEVSSPSIKGISSWKKIDLSSVLSSFLETHLRLSLRLECCICCLSIRLMWEILCEMKENHHLSALMKSIFQHTMSLLFVHIRVSCHVIMLTSFSPTSSRTQANVLHTQSQRCTDTHTHTHACAHAL